jgi:hypothetical protein
VAFWETEWDGDLPVDLDREVKALRQHALDRDVSQEKTFKQFLAYARFHLSDHRPLWAQFSL